MLQLKAFVFVAFIFVNFWLIGTGVASSSDLIHVVKISGEDERAVVKTGDGKMQVIKPGDVLRDGKNGLRVAGYGLENKSGLRDSGSEVEKDKKKLRVAGYELRVVEIAEERVVLEEKKGQNIEKIIVRLENGKQRIERVKKAPEKKNSVYGRK